MMKKYFTILFLFVTSTCFGQIGGINEDNIYIKPFPNHSINFVGILTLGQNKNRDILFLSADSGTTRISDMISHPNLPKTYFVYLEGATKINLLANLHKDSVKNYRYTVIDGDGLRIGKRDMIPAQRKGPSGIVGDFTADFGTYDVYNKILKVSMYKVGHIADARETIIYNKKLQAVELINAAFVKVNPKPDTIRKKTVKDGVVKGISYSTNIQEDSDINLNGGVIESDPNRSYAELTVSAIENIFLYSILIKREDEGETEVTNINDLNWRSDTYGNLTAKLDIKSFNKPGKYEVVIYPKIGKIDVDKIENATRINFEIAETPSTYKDWILPVIIGAICGGLAVYMKSRQMKKRIKEETRKKEMAQMQLNSVRSQLNPHFMFNALAGIQSLMNEQKTDEANQYLGKFARLTRNVLDNKELISLAEEKTLLDDYLQMEQLRFGFNYQIIIQPDVDLNIEIPAMLLQPFVENAVKHGIAEKGKLGEISISFAKNDTDLVLELRDNGNGFDTSKTYDGYGLKLSKNRIVLLNSIYKENNIILDMNADENGTVIKITLKEWL
jgi:two-component system LytT family sensor kinase